MPKVITSNATSSGGDVEYVQINADWNATTGVSAILNKPIIPDDMTGTEILTALKTVDGSGSGLDADKLDGKESTEFAPSLHSHLIGDLPPYPTTLPANGGNADTVGGFTVLKSVPANALFTDNNTTYTEVTTAEIDLGTASTLRTITARRIKYILDKCAKLIHTHTKSDITDFPTSLPANGGTADTLQDLTPTIEELNYVDGVTSNIQSQFGTKAPINSPSLTGTPTSPTPTTGSNNTQIATTEFVQNSMANVGGGDMLKAVYDTNGDGIVDNAKKVNGHTVELDIPINSKLTDTVYNGNVVLDGMIHIRENPTAKVASLITEVSGQLVDFGTNYTQSGHRKVGEHGALFRIDVRDGSPLFNVMFQDANGTPETTPFSVTREGKVNSTDGFAKNGTEVSYNGHNHQTLYYDKSYINSHGLGEVNLATYTVTNCDSALETGTYYTSGAVGSPASDGILIVASHSSTCKQQQFWEFNGKGATGNPGRIFHRHMFNGVWQGWYQIYPSGVNIVTSPTEPNISVGDQWHKEV